jgi:aldose sugar dehydrogenase
MFVGSMNPGWLVRLVIKNGEVALEERYLGDLHERIRDVQEGAHGLLYLITDNSNGRVLRVLPK